MCYIRYRVEFFFFMFNIITTKISSAYVVVTEVYYYYYYDIFLLQLFFYTYKQFFFCLFFLQFQSLAKQSRNFAVARAASSIWTYNLQQTWGMWKKGKERKRKSTERKLCKVQKQILSRNFQMFLSSKVKVRKCAAG